MNDFEALMNQEFPDGWGIDQNLDNYVHLTPALRAVYFGMEALSYATMALHNTLELLALMEGDHPEPELFNMSIMEYLNSKGSMVQILDTLTVWKDTLIVERLGYAFAAWMRAHNLADHIHMLVPLPIGVMPLRLQQEDPVMILPLPRQALED